MNVICALQSRRDVISVERKHVLGSSPVRDETRPSSQTHIISDGDSDRERNVFYRNAVPNGTKTINDIKFRFRFSFYIEQMNNVADKNLYWR